jgi:calcineurin-like phosphoesterase family protein
VNEVHLVISDCHVTADQNLDRFDWLAELINDIEPTKIICIGDFASLDSLSTHHNPGSKTDHELPSFRAEQSAVETALQKMFKYDPVCGDRIMLMGNHEQRWDRFKERFPKVLDHVDIEEWLGYNKHWDFIHPYKAWAEIDGLMYTHVPHTIMGKPVGGANACRTVAMQSTKSVIFGHTHTLNVATIPFINGVGQRMAMSVPAFMNDGNVEPYAAGLPTGWAYGITLIRPQGPERLPSYEYVSMEDLRSEYEV